MLKVLISDYPNVLEERDLSIEVNLLKEFLPADSEISVYPYVNEGEFIERMSGIDVLLTAFLPLSFLATWRDCIGAFSRFERHCRECYWHQYD